MEFVTIHALSRELNLPERVIRYRLLNLIAEAKLNEGEDFRREDFKDDQHFVWKINPLSFMRVTGLTHTRNKPVVNSSVNELLTTSSFTASQSVESDKTPTPTSTASPNGEQVTKHSASRSEGETTLAREMIDLLKEQIKVKDAQIREQGDQLKELNSLSVKLTGTMLQQSQKIENLLRLTGGRDSDNGIVINAANKSASTDNEAVNTASADHSEKAS